MHLFDEFVQLICSGVMVSFFMGMVKRLLYQGDDPL